MTPYYDPLLAKLVVWGENRSEALRRMRGALAETSILGVVTNRAYLQRLLSHTDIVRGAFSTSWVEEHQLEMAAGRERGDWSYWFLVGASLWSWWQRENARSTLAFVPSGFRNSPYCGQRETWERGGEEDEVVNLSYRRVSDQQFVYQKEGEDSESFVHLLAVDGESLRFEFSGRQYQLAVVSRELIDDDQRDWEISLQHLEWGEMVWRRHRRFPRPQQVEIPGHYRLPI